MPLQEQLVPVPFAGGLDTKTDQKQVVLGKLLLLENAVFTQPKKLRKRPGQRAIVSPGITGQGLAAYQDELVTWDGSELFSLVGSNDSQLSKGIMYSPKMTVPWAVRNGYSQSNVDGAATDTSRLYVFEDTRGGAWYAIVDVESGQLVAEGQLDANGQKPRAVVLGRYMVAFWRNTSTGHIWFQAFPTTNPLNPLPAVNFLTNVNATHPSFAVVSDGSRAFLAYNTNASTTMALYFLDQALAATGPVNVSSTTINDALDVALEGQANVAVSWYDGSAVQFAKFSYVDLSAVVAATALETVANVRNVASVMLVDAAMGQRSFNVFYTITAGSSINYKVRQNRWVTGGGAGTPSDFCRSVSVAAKPFRLGPLDTDRIIVPCNFSSTLQTSVFYLVKDQGIDVNQGTAARALLGTSGARRADYALPQTTFDGLQWHMANTQQDLLTTIVQTTGTGDPGGLNGSGRVVFTATGVSGVLYEPFSQQESFADATSADTLLIGGGCMQLYDGSTVTEQGFNVYPEGATTAAVGSGGSLSSGTYFYAFTYEWNDAQGRVHQSAPTLPVSVTTVGSDSTNSTVPTLRITNKTAVNVVAWRTLVNGDVFYRLGSPLTAPNNNTGADTVTINDTAADTDIEGGPTLYTLGGVIENTPPPPCSAVVTWNGRIAYLPNEGEGNTWGVSKVVVPGGPVEFCTDFIFPCDPRGGRITALGAMDDKLVLFKESSIFIQQGQGPDSTGAGNDFGPSPTLLTVDVGCTQQRSIVITPMGLFFKSAKGFYLIERALSTRYIGAEVEAFNDDEVVSAVLLANRNRVQFGLSSGVVLVYDYFVGQWSVFTNHSQVDAVNFQELYTLLRADGGIRQEDPTSFKDLGSFYSMKVTTAWMQLAGLQGYQRCWKVLVLGENKSPHVLRLQAARDFGPVFQSENVSVSADPTWGSDPTWGDSETWGGPVVPFQYQLNLRHQKCQALQLTIQDMSQSGTGESLELSGLTFVVGVKPNTIRLPVAQKVGTIS